MATRVRIYWTPQAQQDLRDIRNFIARDAPLTAASFVQRLRSSVARLRRFPESGQIVPETANPTIQEVLHGSYRVIYRVKADRIDVLTVFHGARLLGEPDTT